MDNEQETNENVNAEASVKSEEVGYKKPPKATQFKKGQSGNPKGRPKKSDDHLDIFEKHLKKKVTLQYNGIPTLMTRKEVIVAYIIQKAATDIRYSKMMMDIFSALEKKRAAKPKAVNNWEHITPEDAEATYMQIIRKLEE